ncbi:MAG: hypothetical protein KBC36_04895 [Spirochaetia bacterium]|nr:hypothetical protein [Spirochaetia bacterium]
MDANIFDKFPAGGLIKTGDEPATDLPSDRKALLNRTGNQLFNSGKFEEARRIFQTTGYSDGLVRVGDRYLADGRSVDALKMYQLAHERGKSDELIRRMALTIQKILQEEEETA